jgi:hypothetical protein
MVWLIVMMLSELFNFRLMGFLGMLDYDFSTP